METATVTEVNTSGNEITLFADTSRGNSVIDVPPYEVDTVIDLEVDDEIIVTYDEITHDYSYIGLA